MKKLLIMVFACFTLSLAHAQTQPLIAPYNPAQPQLNAVPLSGTDWQAAVINIQKQLQPLLILRLNQKINSCKLSQPDNHRAGDTVSIPLLPSQIANYHIGQVFPVWVNQSAVMIVDHPPC